MRLVVLFVTLFFQVGFGQQTQSPFEAVQDFFEAFHHQDFKALSHSFSSSAVLQRATYTEGQSILRNQDVSQFINRVVTRPDNPIWNEVLGKPTVQRASNLATVWVPFRFYLDQELSHCGINQFTLFWDGAQWKILHLIDTVLPCQSE